MVRRSLAFAAMLALSIGAIAAERPHIVYLLADDLGAHDVGFRGGALAPRISTPSQTGGAI